MEITILGSKAKVKKNLPFHSRYSGVLIDEKILLDAGEKTFMDVPHQYIFITHFHPDHARFVEPDEKPFHPDVPLYAPEDHKKAEDVRVLKDEVMVDGYRVTPVPVIHSLRVKSIGYVVEKDGKRIFYSGDVAHIDKDVCTGLGNLDLVITDGSYIRKGGMIRRDKESGRIYGHAGIPDLIRMFKPHTSQIIFTHLGNWFAKDTAAGKALLKQVGKYDIYLKTAYDGMRISL